MLYSHFSEFLLTPKASKTHLTMVAVDVVLFAGPAKERDENEHAHDAVERFNLFECIRFRVGYTFKRPQAYIKKFKKNTAKKKGTIELAPASERMNVMAM